MQYPSNVNVNPNAVPSNPPVIADNQEYDDEVLAPPYYDDRLTGAEIGIAKELSPEKVLSQIRMFLKGYYYNDNEKKYMKATEFDKKFDDGEDISKYLDIENAKRPGLEQKRVNVDFPLWMIQALDKEAKRLGVTRQSLIKIWIAERLQHSSS